MTIETYEYKEKDRNEWEEYLKNCINSSFYHSMDFLEYYKDKKKAKPNHLIFKKDGKIICLLPGGILDNQFISPFCASFNGFVYGKKLKLNDALETVDIFLKYCRQKGIKRITITQPPIIYYKIPNQYIEFALLKNGFCFSNYEVSNFIEVKEDISKDVKKEALKAKRKAERYSVIVKENEDYEAFYPILVKNREKYNLKPTHTLKDLKVLKSILKERLKLFLIYLKRDLIGGGLMFLLNEQTLYAFYWAHKAEFENVRPINKLVFDINDWAFKNGYKYFDFGPSTIDTVPQIGIVRFKETFGAGGVLRVKLVKEL